MPTQHIAILLGATCCVRLATVLRSVATCWLLLAQVWPFSNLSQQHPTHRYMVPNAHNMLRPTMLRYVVLACCDRLAGALCVLTNIKHSLLHNSLPLWKKNDLVSSRHASSLYLTQLDSISLSQIKQNCQNRYSMYDQNGSKTLPFGATHTYFTNLREYPFLPFVESADSLQSLRVKFPKLSRIQQKFVLKICWLVFDSSDMSINKASDDIFKPNIGFNY